MSKKGLIGKIMFKDFDIIITYNYIGDGYFNMFVNNKYYNTIDVDNFDISYDEETDISFYDLCTEEQEDIIREIIETIYYKYKREY